MTTSTMKCSEMWALALSRMDEKQKAAVVVPPFCFSAPDGHKCPTQMNAGLKRFITKRLKSDPSALVKVKKADDTLLPVFTIQLCWVNTIKMLYLLGDDAERDGWVPRLMWDIVRTKDNLFRADSHAVLFNTKTNTYLDFTRYGCDAAERWLIPDTINKHLKVGDMADKRQSGEKKHIEDAELMRHGHSWTATRCREETECDAIQVIHHITHNAFMVATYEKGDGDKFRAVVAKHSANPESVLKSYGDKMVATLLDFIQQDLTHNYPGIYKSGENNTLWVSDEFDEEMAYAKVATCKRNGFDLLNYKLRHLLEMPGLERLEDGNYKFNGYEPVKKESLLGKVAGLLGL